MTIDILIVLIVLSITVFLFIKEYFPVDVVALIVIGILILSGLITPEEGVSGFSNTATVTVAAMFVLSAALFKTGALVTITDKLTTVFKFNFWLGVIILMISVGFISAFINNTPVVAIFIPIIIGLSAKTNHPSSKILMPLSFASMLGGVCSLIGTSTNILVSEAARQHDMAPFSMFEMTPLGLIFFGVGFVYMLTIGIHLIPNRNTSSDLTQKFGLGDYLTEIVLTEKAPSVGKKIKDSPLVKNLEIDILEIVRNDVSYNLPHGEMVLLANDLLKVKCKVESIKKIKEREGVYLKSDLKLKDKDIENEDTILLEAVIAPNSIFIGKTLKEMDYRNKYHSTVLAIRHKGEITRDNIATTKLYAGDTLLLEVTKDHISLLKQHNLNSKNPFLLISEVGLPEYRKDKIPYAVLIILGVIVSASLNLLPIMTAAIVGSILLIITGCIKTNEVYNAINWQIVFLLAGTLSLGVAMDKTGTAIYLSHNLISLIGWLGPIGILSAFYLLTSLLTELMSNNATAILLTPIAYAAATSLGLDPKPFFMAIAFAASASFMTPIGYQTNTMIYGAGNYKFSDFVRVGLPLNIIFWILATFLIPYFFPF